MKTTRPASCSSISGCSSSKSANTSIPESTSTKPGARMPGIIPGARALKGVSDKRLLSSIRKLSETERKTVLSILVHLIEIDRRRLYLEMGYSSLFEFCVKSLGYSRSVAGRRISVARCIRKLPLAMSALASGKVSLTNLSLITGIITTENASDLLSRIAGASKKEVELLVSSRRPRSVIRDRVKPVYVRTEIFVSDTGSGERGEVRSAKRLDGRAAVTPPGGSGKSPDSEDISSGSGPAAAERRMVLEERFEVKFGVDQEFIEKMERLRSLLSTKHHRHLEFEEFFGMLMDEYIERRSPEGRIRRKERREQKKAEKERKVAELEQKAVPGTDSTRAAGTSEKTHKASMTAQEKVSRYIPRKVRDEVHVRDKGRCTYVSPGGRRCGATHDLQIDHKVPFARGGDNSPSNLRLLCGKHNRLEAERAYGKKHMEQYIKEPGVQYAKEQMEQYEWWAVLTEKDRP